MHHFGGDAVVLGALRPVPGVVDDSTVAVLQTGPTLPAADAHAPFIALVRDKPWVPRGSSPTQFVQPVVVDPEMVGDFMDHRHRHLVDDLILGLARR
jgi:hypothetical protein